MTVVSNEEAGNALFHGWSVDGGRTWNRDRIADGDNLGFACCDPSLASDQFGNIFLTYLTSSITVEVAISIDGEVLAHTPVTAKLARHAIAVAVPA